MLNEIERTTTTQAIVEQVIALLKRGELKPGDKLPSENELVEMLGVGRSSIREAKQTLAAMNLIEAHPGRGSFIKEVHPESIINSDIVWLLLADEHVWALYETRELLEVQIAALAAQRATEDDFAVMARALADLEQAVICGESVYDIGLAFHLALVQAAHNSVLVNLYHPIIGLLRKYQRPLYEQNSDPVTELEHHRAIYESLRQGDSDLAREVMRAHLQYVVSNTTVPIPETVSLPDPIP